MLEMVINSAITHTLLIALPIGCALLLRLARCPGWPVVAGALAGILLGPSIYGRVAPESFERHFIGAVAERTTRDAAVRAREAELEAGRAARLDELALRAIDRRHAPAVAEAESAWVDASWRFQRPFRSYTSAIIGLSLIGAGLLRIREREGDARQGLVAPISIGLWSACLPGAAAAASLVWLFDASHTEAALAGAAVAIGPWVLTADDRVSADTAEHGGARMLQTAGRIASAAALITAAWALSTQRAAEGVLWFAPLFALPIGWLLPVPRSREVIRIIRLVLDHALVPSLAACVAIRVELFADFSISMIIVLALLSGDGRWLGAFIGALLPGARGGLRTMRLVLGATAAGPTQLAVAAVAAHTGGLPGPAVLGLLAGAIAIEATAPARRSFARRLLAAEVELEEIDREL